MTKYIIKIFTVIIITCMVYACTDQKDIYKDYLAGGEKVYLAKTDSVHVLSGNNRVRINCILKNAYNVDKIWVYWNTKSDSMSFDYVKSANDVDTLKLDISPLAEKSYIFEIYTKNNIGTKSIKVLGFGNSYGAKYRTNISVRNLISVTYKGTDTYLNWLSSAELEQGTEVNYTNTDGVATTIIVPADSAKVKITDFLHTSTSISYRTVYKPDSSSLDTFDTRLYNFNVPVFVKK